jgi:4a-hydroxytetrahydrobiopterin dehydratase
MSYDKTPLSSEALLEFLNGYPDWKLQGSELVRELELPSFMAAIDYVNRVAQVAERHDHHPDIDIRYTRVVLRLTTHAAGGLTFRDPAVAKDCEALFREAAP